VLLLNGALVCDCLFDLNALLCGLGDDAMIYIYEVVVGMVCCCMLYELESMSCMMGLLYMRLALWELLIGWCNMLNVCVGRNSMTLIVRAQGGASSIGHNSVDPFKEEFPVVPHLLGLIP